MQAPTTGADLVRALRSLGPIEGGADTLIEALMRAVSPGGALVMPAFRLSPALPLTDQDKRLGLTAKIEILPEDAPRTAMGVVADTFRQRPDVHTGEGIFRVSAWDEDAETYANGLQPLIDGGGFALLLGVDIYSLSAMHYVDALRAYTPDCWLTEAWTPDVKPWYAIQARTQANGLVRETCIGEAACMLLPVKPVISLYRQALVEDAIGLYGLG